MSEMIPSKEFRMKHPEYSRLSNNQIWALEQIELKRAKQLSKIITGSFDTIDEKITQFYQTMKQKHKNFTVMDIVITQNDSTQKVSAYIVYQICHP